MMMPPSLPTEDTEYILTHAEQDLLSLRGGHILVTGGSGFFGAWLVESLLHAHARLNLDVRVVVLTRSPERLLTALPHLRAHNALRLVSGGDMLDMERLHDVPFTHAIHAANLPNDSKPDWALRHMNSAVTGLAGLIALAGKNACDSLLLTSSGGAYRAEPVALSTTQSTAVPLREQQSHADDNVAEPVVYGLTKRFSEVWATALGVQHNVRVPIARCFTFAGPYMPLGGGQALGNFLNDALHGRDIMIKGNGKALRTYMYMADLIVWLLALLCRGSHGTPYNVGAEHPVSIADLAHKMADLSRAYGGNVGVRILGEAAPGNAPQHYVPDTSRARDQLGLDVRVDLDTALEKTFRWFREGRHA